MGCSCCDYASVANRRFSAKRAARELAGYRRGKLGPTTGLLRDAIVRNRQHARTLLDVGAGIGILTFELLDRGVEQAVAVDASHIYVAVAKEEAKRRRTAAVTFVEGDFVAVASTIAAAEIVALDRVVCCYEDYRSLLSAAAGHASRVVALSFPRDRWFVRWGVRLENALRRLRGDPFRNFVHPPGDINRLMADAGFKRVEERLMREWAVEVYARQA